MRVKWGRSDRVATVWRGSDGRGVGRAGAGRCWAQARSSSGPRRNAGTRGGGQIRRWWCLGAGSEDALDRAVGRVTDRQARSHAASSRPVPTPARAARPMMPWAERSRWIALTCISSSMTAAVAGPISAAAAGTRSGCASGRRSSPAGSARSRWPDRAGSTWVGCYDLALVQDLHGVPGGAGVDVLSDQPPRHRVQRLADLDVAVRADLAGRPRCQLRTRCGATVSTPPLRRR